MTIMHFIRQVFLLTIALVYCFITYAQDNPRQRISLDEGWKFHFGHAADPARDFNYSVATIFSKSGGGAGTPVGAGFNDSAWRTINLPHDWAVELPFVHVKNDDVAAHGYKPVGGLFPETSIGWYRKQFDVAASDSGSRFQLQFDGIFRDANIWVNGCYLGNNFSGYSGVSFDITDFLKFDEPNVIVVRVDATQYEGWFYEGAGIYRHVWLNRYSNLHIPDGGLFFYTKAGNSSAEVNIETTVKNENFFPSNGEVYTYITDREGNKVGQAKSQKISLSPDKSATIFQKIKLNHPRLWSLNDPYLYRVVAVVKQGDKTSDTVKQRMGIRTLHFDATKGFFLNGEHIKIKGTNNHQDHAGIGSALPDYMQYYRIRLLKNMGSNAYRTSHNPPTPELLDACDSLGMLVLDETRLLNSSSEYLGQFEKMILRDRNHPSVFMWSIGNEEGWIQTNSNGKRIAQTMLARQKELDPTRISTYGADLANVWQGVNEVVPVRGFNYRQYAAADYHRDHPEQPILGTEMGSTVTTRGVYHKDTVRGYVPDQDIIAPWWASRAEEWWKLAAENPYWLGGFIWTGFDYRGEPTPYQWPNINSHFGVMDMCGFPKNIYYYYQSWWTDEDVLHISPHWNWPGKTGQPIDVWVNSNADHVELFLNGKSQGSKDMPRNGHLQWSVNYQPGKLEAVAYKKGKKLTAKVETTGLPAEVVLSPYKTTMLADGRDVTIINISVMDREGREVPDADNMIRFNITGPAKIIGVGNGDPSSHEPDKCADGAWQRSLFNGKAQVIVQSEKAQGTVKFEASAAGLFSGTTDIITVLPESLNQVQNDPKYELKGAAARPRQATKMLGADISFLPQLEERGMKFFDNGVEKDAIQMLKDHGFNYVRLRIFNDPAGEKGYSPEKGFCDLVHTLQMAKRVKAAGMKLLLDFHYSDTWADPGKQFKPAAWENQSFDKLKESLYDHTRNVLLVLKGQGTLPDMVQVGNEINHGLLWPDGRVTQIDQMAQLFQAGVAAVKSVDPTIVIMLHLALGGQNDECVFLIDEMLKRKIHFDVIGLSYYPKWHNTLDDLRDNINDLVRRYDKEVIIVEYSAKKQEVNKIGFELKNAMGTCIWEPLNTWESVVDRDGNTNNYMKVFDEISKKYLNK